MIAVTACLAGLEIYKQATYSPFKDGSIVPAVMPDEITDWSKLKEDTGMYPGCILAEQWCDDHDIMLGVNRPKELSRGEAAIVFANADRVYEAMKKMDQ